LSATGADIRLPDLLEEIAKCERRGQMHEVCMVRYDGLVRFTPKSGRAYKQKSPAPAVFRM